MQDLIMELGDGRRMSLASVVYV